MVTAPPKKIEEQNQKITLQNDFFCLILHLQSHIEVAGIFVF